MKCALLIAALIAVWSGASAEPQADASAMLGYSNCTIRHERELDDGTSNASAVAHVLANKCQDDYRRWLAFVTRRAKSMGVISNYDAALATVISQRTYRRNSN